uniref:Transposase Tc1-like domain-containing protein n=1 Tax=Oncorhynchus tshawytscha TaxID=74940 RepID=A0AAZ3QWA0_ONCTS
MWDRGTTSTELAQEWQQAGVSASACTVRRRLLEDGLVSRRVAKKPLLSRKNTRDRLIFCKRYRDWTAEDWGKVVLSDESPFRLFGTSGKKLIRRRQGERYHQSCVMPTVKHPETIHMWGCTSSKSIFSQPSRNSLVTNNAFSSMIEQLAISQVITKWPREQNIDILGPWPGNYPRP